VAVAAVAEARVEAATAEHWPAAVIPENTTTVARFGSPSQSGAETLIIAFVAKDFSRFSLLVDRLRREQGVELVPAATGAAGLAQLQGRAVDLVIVDEQLDDMSGIEFVEQFVKVNPLANTAIVGSLPEAEFHEATEGLGVLMQLPPRPQERDAENLLAILAKISGLLPAGPQEAPQ
jgi:CheY-like chemotaxis protein